LTLDAAGRLRLAAWLHACAAVSQPIDAQKHFAPPWMTVATIVDVARMAGLSVATVSQTFSAKRPVSPRTSAKVRAAGSVVSGGSAHLAIRGGAG
jgi:hypothetical protein